MSRLVEGLVSGLSLDTLRVATAGSGVVSVAWSDVRSLRARTEVGRWKLGLAVGGGLGLVGGLAVYAGECFSILGTPDDCGSVGLTVLTTVGGALVGALIGSAIRRSRWEVVPLERLRVSLAPQREGRFALGFSVSF